MILLNDKRNNDNNNININNQKNFSVGLIFIFFHIILCGLVIFAQKVCVMNKISSETQVFYTGVYNLIFAFIVCIFQQNFGLDFIVILMTFLNGVVYFSAQKVNDLVFQRMDVSKFAPTSYIQTLFVFIMCGIIYNEKFFFSDLIGSFFIVAFHFYNAFFPIQSKNVVNN
jgi:drug/metabolite transporter (DMT)-like permease